MKVQDEASAKRQLQSFAMMSQIEFQHISHKPVLASSRRNAWCTAGHSLTSCSAAEQGHLCRPRCKKSRGIHCSCDVSSPMAMQVHSIRRKMPEEVVSGPDLSHGHAGAFDWPEDA